jgi:hypothetical protein
MDRASARDRRGKRHHSAVRLHQETLLCIDPCEIKAVIEMVDVIHHHWLEIGVEQRRG